MTLAWLRSNRTVLIVSSSPEEPLLNSAFLHQPHIRLFTSRPDWGGLHLARRKHPDLIIDHLQKPDRDPLSFCRDLRTDAATSTIPLIVVADQELRDQAAQLRADAVLGKPLARREYYDAVRKFIPMPNRRSRRIPINLRFTWSHEGRVVQAFSRDVSPEGAFIRSDRVLPVGARLLVHFCLPGTSDVLSCHAVVRYNSPLGTSGPLAGFGIEYEGLSGEAMDLLESFIESKLQRYRIAR